MKMLKLVNTLLFLNFLWVAGTAISHDYIRNQLFKKIHPVGGMVLLVLVCLHLLMNWKWIRANYFK